MLHDVKLVEHDGGLGQRLRRRSDRAGACRCRPPRPRSVGGRRGWWSAARSDCPSSARGPGRSLHRVPDRRALCRISAVSHGGFHRRPDAAAPARPRAIPVGQECLLRAPGFAPTDTVPDCGVRRRHRLAIEATHLAESTRDAGVPVGEPDLLCAYPTSDTERGAARKPASRDASPRADRPTSAPSYPEGTKSVGHIRCFPCPGRRADRPPQQRSAQAAASYHRRAFKSTKSRKKGVR